MSYRPRRRWAALLLAVPIAVVLAVPIAVAGLSGFGPAPAPVAPVVIPAPLAPVLETEAIPAVNTSSPDSVDQAPGSVISITGDSVGAQSPAGSPGGGVQPVRQAGGARAGVDMSR